MLDNHLFQKQRSRIYENASRGIGSQAERGGAISQAADREKRKVDCGTGHFFRKTYEDFAAGQLNEKHFEQLSQDYESEQAEIEKQTAELKVELAQFDSDSLRTDKFMELVKRYTDFSELTPAVLHEFVEKVVVHEADRSSGRREHQVDVYLNYIGQFDVTRNLNRTRGARNNAQSGASTTQKARAKTGSGHRRSIENR